MLYSIIAFCGHNNYGNRTVEKLDTLADYLEAFDIDKDYMQTDVNFITGDGVHTSIVLGSANKPVLKDFDYLVVYAGDEIISRWFVLNSTHNTYGQLTVQLQRDVVKDIYEELIDAPMFIEKAILPYDNPLIFNQENMTYNQIKTNEWSLRDRSKVAWIVGYFSRFNGQETTSITGSYTPDSTQYVAYAGGAQDFIDEIQSKHYLVGYEKFSLIIKESALNPTYWNASFSYYGSAGVCTYLGTSGGNYYFCGNAIVTKARTYDGNDRLQSAYLDKPNFDWDLIASEIETIAGLDSSSDVNRIVSTFNGQLIKTSDDKIYRVSITQTTRRDSISLDTSDADNIKNNIIASLRNTFGYNPGTTGAGNVYGNPWANHYVEFDVTDYHCTLTSISDPNTVNYSIPTSRVKCQDQPYDMFVMPYINDNTKVRFTTTVNQTWSNASEINLEITKNIAQHIKVNTTTAEIYDIQILPYCPIPSMIEEMDNLEISDAEEVKRSLFRLETLQEHKDYEFIKNQQNDIISIMFFPNLSTFTFDIDAPIMSPHKRTAMGRKVASETEMFRLCSPNYSGQFEWNIEKAGGCAYFNVDCTYLPHNPWIHITPEFGLLYGKDYNDARGLVCSGDFSLAQMTSAWTQYQMQNKNYQQIFDRGIQSMETKRVWERTSEIAGAAAGTVAGVAAGAKLGGVAGGIIGGITSAAAGAVDVLASEMLYNENKDYTQDMFSYNLGNIKALPQGLGRSSSFNANSKLFPFVEKYDCTDEEKEALRQKINYNGMTVNAIGKIRDYLFNQASPNYPHNYIKGRLIRLESEKIDNEYLAQLIQELEKGVYFN